MTNDQRVAVVHDWFTLPGGAEKVLSELIQLCPNSEVFTLFNLTEGGINNIVGDRRVHTSGLNRLPFVEKYYRQLLPFAQRAIEKFDLSDFDLVVSSSAALAKGVITRPGQRHIAYVHSPARYAWDLMHEYLNAHHMKGLKKLIVHEMMYQFRNWDVRTTNGVDVLVANSEFIRDRIWKIYRRDSVVVYPPVDVQKFRMDRNTPRHFIVASRLVDYKRIDLVVQAFSRRPDLKLIVLGEGPDAEKLKRMATPNVQLLGRVPIDQMRQLYSEARAFVFAALEDFGIAPVEAQAAGIPVIAFGQGGTAETVIAGKTGVLFKKRTVEDILEAITEFEKIESKIDPDDCVHNADRFAPELFRIKMNDLIFNAQNGDVRSAQ